MKGIEPGSHDPQSSPLPLRRILGYNESYCNTNITHVLSHWRCCYDNKYCHIDWLKMHKYHIECAHLFCYNKYCHIDINAWVYHYLKAILRLFIYKALYDQSYLGSKTTTGGESKGNFSEEPTCTRTTFQGAHIQGLGKCVICFHSKGIMSNKYFKSTIY